MAIDSRRQSESRSGMAWRGAQGTFWVKKTFYILL